MFSSSLWLYQSVKGWIVANGSILVKLFQKKARKVDRSMRITFDWITWRASVGSRWFKYWQMIQDQDSWFAPQFTQNDRSISRLMGWQYLGRSWITNATRIPGLWNRVWTVYFESIYRSKVESSKTVKVKLNRRQVRVVRVVKASGVGEDEVNFEMPWEISLSDIRG